MMRMMRRYVERASDIRLKKAEYGEHEGQAAPTLKSTILLDMQYRKIAAR